MAGLHQPSKGRLIMDGRDVTGWPVQRRNVAMVYQQFINYPWMSTDNHSYRGLTPCWCSLLQPFVFCDARPDPRDDNHGALRIGRVTVP
jgi:hypothetical protein